MEDITGLLQRWREGDKAAERAVVGAIYPHLRALAQRQLRDANYRLTLRATELVSELYLRLHDRETPYESRRHFMAIASSAMRCVMIDLLRARTADKRGGQMDHVSLEPGGEGEQLAAEEPVVDWVVLDAALTALERRNAIRARVVELRYFGGLSTEEIAAELDISVATVGRHWVFARAWLHKRL